MDHESLAPVAEMRKAAGSSTPDESLTVDTTMIAEVSN